MEAQSQGGEQEFEKRGETGEAGEAMDRGHEQGELRECNGDGRSSVHDKITTGKGGPGRRGVGAREGPLQDGDRRLARISARCSRFTPNVFTFSRNVFSFRADVSTFVANVSSFPADVSSFGADVSSFGADVSSLEADVSTFCRCVHFAGHAFNAREARAGECLGRSEG